MLTRSTTTIYTLYTKAVVFEESHNDNLFQLTPSATAVESIQYDNAFRMCFSDPNQGSASADYIADNNLAKKVAVIYNSSDTYSSGIYQKLLPRGTTIRIMHYFHTGYLTLLAVADGVNWNRLSLCNSQLLLLQSIDVVVPILVCSTPVFQSIVSIDRFFQHRTGHPQTYTQSAFPLIPPAALISSTASWIRVLPLLRKLHPVVGPIPADLK